jgi:hypothetical protein
MKFCARCNASYPLTFFPKARFAPDGHSRVCIDCEEKDFDHMNKIQSRTSAPTSIVFVRRPSTIKKQYGT